MPSHEVEMVPSAMSSRRALAAGGALVAALGLVPTSGTAKTTKKGKKKPKSPLYSFIAVLERWQIAMSDDKPAFDITYTVAGWKLDPPGSSAISVGVLVRADRLDTIPARLRHAIAPAIGLDPNQSDRIDLRFI